MSVISSLNNSEDINMKVARSLFVAAMLGISFVCAPKIFAAESYISSQSHNGAVSTLVPLETASLPDMSFFSAGNDGFLIKWNPDGSGEHYQVSDLPISALAKNPVNADIALYESNNIALNRITVMDWTRYRKRYSKRFKNAVTCLAYSEQGSYLIVGTATVNGIYILNGQNGALYKTVKNIPGIITMAKTGPTEKTAVMYSPAGFLYYYDLQKGKLIAKFQTEASLEQATLFGTGKFQNRFFAGIKGNSIYIIDAVSGKTLANCAAANPFICASPEENEEGLYFINSKGRSYALNLISYSSLEVFLKTPGASRTVETTLVKNFMGLQSNDSFTAVVKNEESIILGTQAGDIYKMPDLIESSETYSLSSLTERTYQQIYDIASDENGFYFLTKDAVYMSSYSDNAIQKMAENSSQTNMELYKENFILWSQDTRKDVQMVPLSGIGVNPMRLFTPQSKLQSLHIYGDTILYVQGNNSVKLYNIENGKQNEIFTGTSIEDAVLINEDTVYVAKSAVSATDSPLVSVNIRTRETVALKLKGNVVFSLSNAPQETGDIYGIVIETLADDSSSTEVFAYSPESKTLKTLLKINDEDGSAFTSLSYPYLYTNIGKNQIYAHNIKTSRNITYKRASAMPMKLSGNKNNTAILNKDGSISWYRPNSQAVLSNWYLTIDNNWLKF